MAISKEDFQLYFLLVLIGTFALLSFLVFWPYLFYVIGGIILVYINYPLYRRIKQVVRNESIASTIAIIILLVLTVLPTIFLVTTTATQAQTLITQIGADIPTYIDTATLETQIEQLTGSPVSVNQMIRDAANDVADQFSTNIPNIIQTAFDITVGLLLMGFTMYYLFKDGDEVVDAVMDMTPLRDNHKVRLLTEVDHMAEAILIGHLLTATVQGIIAGIGLLAVGIPNVIFWTFIMILLGLVPLIGSFVVWGPTGLYLIFFESEPLAGIALLLYGATVVGFTDNVVRAKFVESRTNIHPLLVLIGVIGGIPVFGLLGVVLGPLVLGVFVALLRVYSTDMWTT